MKPRNFPQRIALRRARAEARASLRTDHVKVEPYGARHVKDITIRLGRQNRYDDGSATYPDQPGFIRSSKAASK